jgi:NAD+ synthase (glutamine-hydrolysing)
VTILRVALAQINSTVGDLDGNAEAIRRCLDRARAEQADLIAFPELAVTGYPPEDLLLKRQFIEDSRGVLESLAPYTEGIAAVIGFVDPKDDRWWAADERSPAPYAEPENIARTGFNAAAILFDGRLVDVYHKCILPNYGVFDEERYFEPGDRCPVYTIGGVPVGVNVCEDIWYASGPTQQQANAGARVIVNINGSPYQAGKAGHRRELVASRARDNGVFVCYINLVGGQDELVFDGASIVVDPSGGVVARGPQFEEDLIFADIEVADGIQQPEGAAREATVHVSGPRDSRRPPLEQRQVEWLEPEAEVYAALVTGTRDYVDKNGFSRVLIGLSGGIDSSIVATIARDALGADRVVGVAMPSRYNADESLKDARELALNLGVEFHVISVEPAFEALLSTLGGMFEGTEPNVAEENLQARIRGNILMAISNKFGWLVLPTGNKSEMAMGYATLYGDMVGGFAMIKDVPKTLVYKLAEWRNRSEPKVMIPERVLTKAPTAELRPNQKDEDSLPPYAVLDPVLKAYVEDDVPFQEMLASGMSEAIVKQVIQAVDRNEYKRRQSPPGVKITSRSFGRDRRLPIVNRYRAF